MLKPHALKEGDTLGFVAPSGPIAGPEVVWKAADRLREYGFCVKVFESCYQQYGYLAGSDPLRADDLNTAFADDEVDGIVCLRGGYGATRILDLLDYKVIAAHPKVFVGYSDITALHIAFQRKCGFCTFHGPMAAEIGEKLDPYTWENWKRALMSAQPLGLLENPLGAPVGTLFPGKACGPIVGGNLSLVVASLETDYEIDTCGRLLLLEDIGEEPYRVDRMLTQLRLAGKFDECNGIILGDWRDCEAKGSGPSLTLHQVFEDVIVPSRKPAILNLKAGHCKRCLTVPLGVQAVLDADACALTVIENSAV